MDFNNDGYVALDDAERLAALADLKTKAEAAFEGFVDVMKEAAQKSGFVFGPAEGIAVLLAVALNEYGGALRIVAEYEGEAALAEMIQRCADVTERIGHGVTLSTDGGLEPQTPLN